MLIMSRATVSSSPAEPLASKTLALLNGRHLLSVSSASRYCGTPTRKEKAARPPPSSNSRASSRWSTHPAQRGSEGDNASCVHTTLQPANHIWQVGLARQFYDWRVLRQSEGRSRASSTRTDRSGLLTPNRNHCIDCTSASRRKQAIGCFVPCRARRHQLQTPIARGSNPRLITLFGLRSQEVPDRGLNHDAVRTFALSNSESRDARAFTACCLARFNSVVIRGVDLRLLGKIS